MSSSLSQPSQGGFAAQGGSGRGERLGCGGAGSLTHTGEAAPGRTSPSRGREPLQAQRSAEPRGSSRSVCICQEGEASRENKAAPRGAFGNDGEDRAQLGSARGSRDGRASIIALRRHRQPDGEEEEGVERVDSPCKPSQVSSWEKRGNLSTLCTKIKLTPPNHLPQAKAEERKRETPLLAVHLVAVPPLHRGPALLGSTAPGPAGCSQPAPLYPRGHPHREALVHRRRNKAQFSPGEMLSPGLGELEKGQKDAAWGGGHTMQLSLEMRGGGGTDRAGAAAHLPRTHMLGSLILRLCSSTPRRSGGAAELQPEPGASPPGPAALLILSSASIQPRASRLSGLAPHPLGWAQGSKKRVGEWVAGAARWSPVSTKC